MAQMIEEQERIHSILACQQILCLVQTILKIKSNNLRHSLTYLYNCEWLGNKITWKCGKVSHDSEYTFYQYTIFTLIPLVEFCYLGWW